MVKRARHRGHDKYKARINNMFASYGDVKDPETQANNAKYLAVLVSGYLEQAVKELLLHFASQGSREQVSRYIEATWPISRNMTDQNISSILGQFNDNWKTSFEDWLKENDDRKSHINSIVSWRNYIAHGQESNTTGVTMSSVKNAFATIMDTVTFIETLIKS